MMKRKQVIDLLTDYQPDDPEERLVRQRMLRFIRAHPDCFERSLLEGHLTASAWLVDSTKNKALLLHHAKLDIWCQPGGHCDGCPDPLYTAVKEAKEESGIEEIVPVTNRIFDIDIHTIAESGAVPAHLHYDIRFLLRTTEEKTARPNRESKGFLWIERHSALPTTERSILRMKEKWIKSFPLCRKNGYNFSCCNPG